MRMPGMSSAWAAVSRDTAMRRISHPAQRVLVQSVAGILRPARGFSGIIHPQAGTFLPARGLATMQPSARLFDRARSLLPAHQAGIFRPPEGIIGPEVGRIFQPVRGLSSALSYDPQLPQPIIVQTRRRGRCVSKYLTYDDVVVYPEYGTFGLKNSVANDTDGATVIAGMNPSEFKGYIALKNLFVDVMIRMHRPDVLDRLTPDVSNWIESLKVAAHDTKYEVLALRHAALLGRHGRAWLSIRVATIVRCELVNLDKHSNFINDLYVELEAVGRDIQKMHPFFNEWYTHALRYGDRVWQPPILEPEDMLQMLEEKATADNGYQVVSINRNGLLHPNSARLTKISPVWRNYTYDDVIDLLHLKTANYLPIVQNHFMYWERWDLLGMDSYLEKVPC
ncbi:hypothetical protein ACP4OV_012003 [Aristida adscensionis]